MPQTITITCDGSGCDVDLSDASLAADANLRRHTITASIARKNGPDGVEHNQLGTLYFCSVGHASDYLQAVTW
jgi:hypothetical protein